MRTTRPIPTHHGIKYRFFSLEVPYSCLKWDNTTCFTYENVFLSYQKKSPENQIFPSRDNKETYLKFNDDLYQYPSNLGPFGQFLFLIPKKERAKFYLKLAQLLSFLKEGGTFQLIELEFFFINWCFGSFLIESGYQYWIFNDWFLSLFLLWTWISVNQRWLVPIIDLINYGEDFKKTLFFNINSLLHIL